MQLLCNLVSHEPIDTKAPEKVRSPRLRVADNPNEMRGDVFDLDCAT
jgi:hypothetical protein